MGTIGKKIVKLDVKKLIGLLNKALADEWLAYYQYWVGAKIAQGPMRTNVVAELEEHATEELKHAVMLVERIIQLGGTPILEPKDWYKLTNCGYSAPKDPFVVKILNQNIEGEQCAIKVYNKLVKLTEGKDDISNKMIVEILQDEVKHEEDLQAILTDIQKSGKAKPSKKKK
jgi:bacterioferritin